MTPSLHVHACMRRLVGKTSKRQPVASSFISFKNSMLVGVSSGKRSRGASIAAWICIDGGRTARAHVAHYMNYSATI